MILFGPESSGLTTEELATASVLVRIQAAARQPTLNLAQAVLVVAWELWMARGAPKAAAAPGTEPRATGGELMASLISDRSENGFARLPVREDECVVVTLVRPAVSQAIPTLEAALREIPVGSGRAPDIAHLIPTARSLLR